jgi:hypothetical protein
MSLENLDTIIAFAVVMLLLSLQITILCQIVVAVTNLRGRNLARGLAGLLAQVDPKLDEHAEEIMDRVLRHSVLNRWFGSRANTLRPDELIRLLDDIASDPDSGLSPDALKALQATLSGTVPGLTPELMDKAQAVSRELENLFPAQANAMRQAVDKAFGKVRNIEAGVAVWFGTISDRMSERFALSTRMITVVFAVIVAFGLQIDALRVLHQLASNGELRARLAQSADQTVKEAESMVAGTSARPLASQVLQAVKETVGKPAADLIGEVPGGLITRGDGENWLESRITAQDQRKLVLTAFDRQFDKATRELLGELRKSADQIKGRLQQSELTLIPNPFPSGAEFFQSYTNRRHLLGMLMTALLLSVGAPFWFNMLRQLASLRPLLAGKVEKEAVGSSSRNS